MPRVGVTRSETVCGAGRLPGVSPSTAAAWCMADVYLDSSSAGYQYRVRRLMVAVVLVFGALAARLAHLQLIEGDDLHDASVRNFARTVRLAADRGSIFDRNGKLLAVNRPSFDLYVTPSRIKDLDGLLGGLRDVLALDEFDLVRLRERIEEPRGMWRHRAMRISRDIDRRRVALAEALRARVDGISIRVRYQRHYPEGPLGAHLVGYLGRPTAAELDKDTAGRHHVDSMIGRFGVEKRFENILGGRDGYERYVVDARGARRTEGWAERAMTEEASQRPAERGHDLHLTVDVELQRILARALARYESGAAVVVDTRDGSVLGIVSKPSFDPNEWSGRLSTKTWRATRDNPYHPMLDKSVHAYFPGSVYKVVTALAGMEEGVLDPDEAIESPGSYEYGNHTFRCHKPSGHGAVNLDVAMAASADVYFYKLGEQLGIDTLARYAHKFGFGEPTRLGINSESGGRVPTRAFHVKEDGAFQHGLALSTAIGQGAVRTTPVQMAMAFAAIANGGTVYAPRILDRITTAEGALVSTYEPEAVGDLGADEEHLARLAGALDNAVNDPKRATGHLAAVPGGRVAGKTGTAQVRKIIRGHLRQTVKRFKDRDHAWFAAFAPVEAPRIAVVVFLEHGGSGGRDAAPIARQIIEAYHQRIEPLFSTTASNTPRKRSQRVR